MSNDLRLERCRAIAADLQALDRRRLRATNTTSQTSSRPLEIATRICAMIGAGMALGEVADQNGMPCVRTIMNWLSRHAAFADLYAKAVEARAEDWVAELMSPG